MNVPPRHLERGAVQASAPGSLMLFGEHAVLHGHRALCAAIDRRLSITLVPRSDMTLRITSSLGEREMPVDALDPSPPFQFLTTALAAFRDQMVRGLDVRVHSEFRDDQGLGSSAAVTVAAFAALNTLYGIPCSLPELQARSREVIRSVQGAGSGADAAASVLGGVVEYRTEPRELRRIADALPLTIVFSGSKEKTAVVIEKVERLRAAHPRTVEDIFRVMDDVTGEATEAIAAADWRRLGTLANIAQGLMDALGVNTARLAEIAYTLRALPGVHGAKISGAGLGDCVIGMGTAASRQPTYPLLPFHVSGEGVHIAIA
jgi:mevalonate kinase